MYKEYLKGVEGIEAFPLFSLLVFFVFFLSVGLYVWSLRRKYVDEMSAMPLEADDDFVLESAYPPSPSNQ
jgi:cytochrome c oxidase cbb3-type subunit 3